MTKLDVARATLAETFAAYKTAQDAGLTHNLVTEKDSHNFELTQNYVTVRGMELANALDEACEAVAGRKGNFAKLNTSEQAIIRRYAPHLVR